MNDFKRENRYLVFKNKDIQKHLNQDQQNQLANIAQQIFLGRQLEDRQDLECVVIESDWSIYNKAWNLVKQEFNTRTNQSKEDAYYKKTAGKYTYLYTFN